MSVELIEQLVTVSIGMTIATSIMLFVKQYYDRKRKLDDQTEVKQEVEKVFEIFADDDTNDILKLMRRNVAELKEYYTINKQQARNAFSSALIVCFLGFFLFTGGLIGSFFTETDQNIILFSTISGTIVEIISGLFFWLYSQSLKQINLFHESLRNTEKFLTAIQLAENVSEKNKDLIYGYIIQSIFKQEALNNKLVLDENEIGITQGN